MIGLETHIQLNMPSPRSFCACKTDSWEDAPNSNICPWHRAAGVLPVLMNAWWREAVLWPSHDARCSRFPISPQELLLPRPAKGYQIRSSTCPSRWGGSLELPIPAAAERRARLRAHVRIHKLHIEKKTPARPRTRQRAQVDFTAAACDVENGQEA